MNIREYAAQNQQPTEQPQPIEQNWLDVAAAQIQARDNEQLILSLKAVVNAGIERRQNPGAILLDMVQTLFGQESQQSAALADATGAWATIKAEETGERVKVLERQQRRLRAMADSIEHEAQLLRGEQATFAAIATQYNKPQPEQTSLFP